MKTVLARKSRVHWQPIRAILDLDFRITYLVNLVHQSPITNHQSPITNHQSPITFHQSPITNHQSPFTLEHHSIPLHIRYLVGVKSYLGKNLVSMLAENRSTSPYFARSKGEFHRSADRFRLSQSLMGHFG